MAMKFLITLAHPSQQSQAHLIHSQIVSVLRAGGHEVRVRDLYAEGFDAILTKGEWDDYFADPSRLFLARTRDIEDLSWAEALVLVFPTWAFGPPAILKGWFEKAFLPGHAFTMPGPLDMPFGPGLPNIRRLICVTSGGSPSWLVWLIGQPVRRTITRGYRLMFHWTCRTKWFQLHRMDDVTDAQRQAFNARVLRYFSSL